MGFSSSMQNLPQPGTEPMCPALADRFLTTTPPGQSQQGFFNVTSIGITWGCGCMRILIQYVWGDSAGLTSSGDTDAAGPGTSLWVTGVRIQDLWAQGSYLLWTCKVQFWLYFSISLVILKQSLRMKTQQRKTAREPSEVAILTTLCSYQASYCISSDGAKWDKERGDTKWLI